MGEALVSCRLVSLQFCADFFVETLRPQRHSDNRMQELTSMLEWKMRLDTCFHLQSLALLRVMSASNETLSLS